MLLELLKDWVEFYPTVTTGNVSTGGSNNFNYYSYSQSTTDFPPLNIYQTEKSIELTIAIAGFGKEHIKVETEDEYLIVSGENSDLFTEKESEEKAVWIKRNIRKNKFSRAFKFPDSFFDYKNPKVTLKDGLLKILISKNKDLISAKKTIEIE
jgi:HSP20 family molecular chaperone IbpA